MQRDVPSSPELLERATQGEPAALSALVCAHKERAYLLAVALSGGGFDTELSSDLSSTFSELADACLPGARDTEPPARDYDPGRSGTVRIDGSSTPSQQELLRRWQVVHRLCRALAALGHEERALVVLVDLEGLESDQVAWLLSVSEAEICQRLFAARSLLHKQLLGGAGARKSA
jgi:hypothetical protein